MTEIPKSELKAIDELDGGKREYKISAQEIWGIKQSWSNNCIAIPHNNGIEWFAWLTKNNPTASLSSCVP